MTEPKHIVCPHCSTINRVPAAKPALQAKCGKCGHLLFDGHPVALDAAAFGRHIGRDDIPVVVDFWADWCGPCKMMAPEFAKAAQDLEPAARFAKLDTEAAQSVAAQYGIRSIPTMVVFKGGHEVARRSGAMPARELKEWLRPYL